MAVTKARDWQAITTASPNNQTVILPAGTNRTLILVQGTEFAGDFTTSCAVGGVSADGRGGLFWESGGTQDLKVQYWYWNEAAVAAMSATTSVQYTNTVSPTKWGWTYAVFASVSAVVADTSVDTSVSSASPMTIPTSGSADGYTVIYGVRDTSNRTFNGWGNLTEIQDVAVSAAMRIGLADGAWAAGNETVLGDNISDVMLLASLVLLPATAVNIISGSGSPSGVIATIAGTGERIIVGNGSASVIAAIVSATAERIITATGSASPNIVVFSATGTAGPPAGNFVVAAPVQTTINDDPIGKSVNVQGL